jgi:uncharacterized protein
LDAGGEVIQAVRERDVARLRAALGREPGAAAAVGSDGMSALMLAIYHRFGDGIMLLSRAKMLSIHEAAALGDAAAVESALQDPAALESVSVDGARAIHLAAHFGHASVVGLLIARGADIRTRTSHGFANTPLHAAAAGRRCDCAQILLEAGADANALDANAYTPLHIAAAGGEVGLIRLLLAHGAEPDARGPGRTPMEMALERGEAEAAALLRTADRRG